MVVEEYDRTEHPLLSHKKRRLINNTPNFFLLALAVAAIFLSLPHTLSLYIPCTGVMSKCCSTLRRLGKAVVTAGTVGGWVGKLTGLIG